MIPQVTKGTGLVVSDFDGFATDVEKESVPYEEAFYSDFAQVLGLSLRDTMRIVRDHQHRLVDDPSRYSRRNARGQVVAPPADPYLASQGIATVMMQERGTFGCDPAQRKAWCDTMWNAHYPKTLKVFRPGAVELFTHFAARASCVVTNSSTDAVREKLKTLVDGDGRQVYPADRVYGGAQKFETAEDGEFDLVPESHEIAGLRDPVLLRRHCYFKVLDTQRQMHGCTWENVTGFGDIYPLDGALLLALGATFVQLVTKHTSPQEIAFLRMHPNAHVVYNLHEALTLLQ